MKDMVQIRRGGKHEYRGPEAKIGRSQFNRSHGLKMTFNASYLYPMFLDDVLPGDTMTMKLNGFTRIFSPLLSPVMDNIELETFWFFVPNRIVWANWKFFQGEHDAAGAQDTTYTVPVLATGLTVDHDDVVTGHGLAAAFGLPHGLATATVTGISCLPFRAYNLIVNHWFNDQNLQGAHFYTENTDNGPDGVGDFFIVQIHKKHDYFTSALPYLQKGTAQIVAGDVIGDPAGQGGYGAPQFRAADDSPPTGKLLTGATGTAVAIEVGDAWTDAEQLHWRDPELIAQIDINALRQSVAIQRLLETDARGGTRYSEIIKSHWGVTVPDFRLQKPEYLGGGKSMLNVSAIANTSSIKAASSVSGNDEAQGDLKGVGTGVIQGHGWAQSFTEHGYVIGLVRARGDLTYFQGVDRHWSRSTRYDFYMPALANLGEQSILNKELWVSNSAAIDDAVFGYQERWSEYRMKSSKLVNHFNPDITGSLSHWHLAEDFGTLPALNSTFTRDQTPMSRVQAVTTEPDFMLDVWFDYKCARPIPVHSIPSLQARF